MKKPTQLSLYKNSLYFVDSDNYRIREIDLNTTVVGTGINAYSADGQALSINLRFPRGIVFDDLGNMSITEEYYIRKVNLDGFVSTIAGTGNRGNTGDGGDPLLATFGLNYYLSFDSNYNLHVFDGRNNNIRVLS
jgi:hypothetical protein